MKNLKSLVLAAAVACPAAFAGGASPFYVGADAGIINDGGDGCDYAKSLLSGSSLSVGCDDDVPSVRIHAGMQASDNFAFELGGMFTGDFEYKYSGTGISGNDTGSFTALDATVLGSYHFTDAFSARARLGLSFWDRDSSGSLTYPNPDYVQGGTEPETLTITADSSDDGTDILYGAGVSYSVLDNADIRVDYTRIEDYNLYTAGFVWRF